MNQSQNRISGLYAVTPDTADLPGLLQKTEAALAGGARIIQYRNKVLAASSTSSDRRANTEIASALATLCRQRGAIFIVNDDPHLALEIGADGVHLGGTDIGLEAARKLLGNEALIGVSCYDDLQRAKDAQQAGADYVAFGSVFASSTKPSAPRASLELFHQAKKQLSLPVVAIGGITLHNAADVIQAGADAIAVINAVFTATNVELAARNFSNFFQS